MVRVDNVGAIFMASNTTIAPSIKHVDFSSKIVRKHVEDGVLFLLSLLKMTAMFKCCIA